MRRNPLFLESWPLIVAHYGGTCVCCRRSSAVVPNHVLPLKYAPDARNVLANLQPLCRSCAAFKGERPEDYRPDLGAWIIHNLSTVTQTLHSTKRRARYWSSGWALTAGNCQSRRNCHQKLSPSDESVES